MRIAALLVLALAACSRATPQRAVTPAPGDSAPTGASARPAYTPADVHFVSGMIHHHGQALIMAAWATDSIHGASPAIRRMSERITVSQGDEIALLERWLRERNERMMAHHGLMPGMLTPAQLAELERARGAEFDQLFLTYMIQHHLGAVTMVDELLGAQGAAQDGLVFRMAADIHADQTTEIERMQRMLAALPSSGGKSP
jgi:uncharacterized protein (DUF305 family)